MVDDVVLYRKGRSLFTCLAIALLLPFTGTYSQTAATSDLVGFVRVETLPGQWTQMAPVFSLPTVASGLAPASTTQAQVPRVNWFQSAGFVPDSAPYYILPLTGTLASRPVFPATTVFGTLPWAYSLGDGSVTSSTATLASGNQLVVQPFSDAATLAGPAAWWELSTQFRYRDRFGSMHGVSTHLGDGSSFWQDPVEPTKGAFGPFQVHRPLNATGPLEWVLSGVSLRDAPSNKFLIRPGSKTMVFRPDGKPSTPLLAPTAGIYLNSTTTATAVAAGATYAAADKLLFVNPNSGNEDEYFYLSAAPAGWRYLSSGVTSQVVPSTVNLPPGGALRIWRASTATATATITLSRPTNLDASGTTIPVPITSKDGDIIPDAWEKSYFPTLTPTAALPGGDPDFDGFTNAEEYLLGGNPAVFDHPALPMLHPHFTNGVATSVKLTFQTTAGCRYRIETRAADQTTWTILHPAVVGTGARFELLHSLNPGMGRAAAQFYRVVGISPQDSDGDGLTDYEERMMGTSSSTADLDGDGVMDGRDTDGDGMEDGLEAKTAGRNPLDYWDNAVFKFVLTGDRQYVETKALPEPSVPENMPGADPVAVPLPARSTRAPIAVKISRTLNGASVPLPSDLRVSCILTRGSAYLSESPSDYIAEKAADATTHVVSLSIPVDATGTARFYVTSTHLEALDTDVFNRPIPIPIQGVVTVRVDSDPQNKVLYNESFIVYPSQYLGMIDPNNNSSTQLTPIAWLRADRGLTIDTNGEVTQWADTTPENNFKAVKMPGMKGPTVSLDASGRARLDFNKLEGLLMDEFPTSSYTIIVAAEGKGARTASAASTATTGITAGTKGQFYVISGSLPSALPNLPVPYDSTTWRSVGVSVGASSVGLFDLGPLASVWSPSLHASTTVSTVGQILSLSGDASLSPHLRIDSKAPKAVIGPQGVVMAQPPRFIGGASGTDAGTGMFWGNISDIIVYPGILQDQDLQRIENILRAEHVNYVNATSGYTSIRVGSLDADADNLPDWWEIAHYGDIQHVAGSTLCPGAKGKQLTHRQAFLRGTHPRLSDTDGDGIDDYREIYTYRTSPVAWDTDNDLLPDGDPAELKFWRNVVSGTTTIRQYKNLDPTNGRTNSDGQGFAEGWDNLIANYGHGQDSDGDGLSDLFEVAWLNSRPDFAEPLDTDNDGIADAWEMAIFGNLTTAGIGTDSESVADGISDRDESILGLDVKVRDTLLDDGDDVRDDATEAIEPDTQGRIKKVGTQEWAYDKEGSITTKN
jgi:hypothetical protein